MLCDISQSQIPCDSSHMRHLETENSQGQKVEAWLPGGGGGERGLLFNRNRVLLREDEKVLEMGGDGCTKVRVYLTLLNCTLKSG